jgi:hypothetical protein
MRRTVASVALALLVGPAVLSGCAAVRPVIPLGPSQKAEQPASQQPAADATPVVQRPAWVTPVTEQNFRQVVQRYHPNEMGHVLILEYHDFKNTEERWARTRENFRKDLEMLYAKGFRAVNLLDYLNDKMPLPAGTSPVIFTFDDSLESQVKLVTKDGKVEADPQSAVGIMLQFKKEHPDFGAAGTFYINFTPEPFRERANWQQKIKFLVENGFEIANHTQYHEDLSTLTDKEVQEALGMQVKRMQEVLPGYDGSTLALPFGIWPKHKELAISGEFDGVKYKHRAVLLVGADPADSPYDKRLDVMALPRVQGIDSEFERWMPYLETYRYVSDGDPDTVVIPEDWKENLNESAVKGKKVLTYNPADVAPKQ